MEGVGAVGKGKRTRTQQRALTGRRVVVISALEIGHKNGMVTLRGGLSGHATVPLRVAMHGQLFSALMQALHEAALDAEEEYWDLVIPMVRQLGENPDQLEVEALLDRWLRKQNWQAALRAMPDVPPGEPFAITLAGHVGLALDPPYTPSPTLAIFDPLQLHRTKAKMRTALDGALSTAPTAPWSLTQSLADVLRFLREQPWRPLDVPGPQRDEAKERMQQMRAEFLSRSPFVRPEENTLDITHDVETATELPEDDVASEDEQCPNCETSRLIGGILCVCGHDWSCHDDNPPDEPCSHCPCDNMQTPEDPAAGD